MRLDRETISKLFLWRGCCMTNSLSPLHKHRLHYRPALPAIFRNLHRVAFVKGKPSTLHVVDENIHVLFPKTFETDTVVAADGPVRSTKPLRIGVVFSGGQASGGHNVIAGIFDTILALHPESKLFGFLGGPGGVVNSISRELDKEIIDAYRNQGGFDLIGSGRTKIETAEQLDASLKTVQKLELDGLVIIGGDDSNTNAAMLAEYFIQNGCKTKVVGVPKTIDGDLKNEHIELSFGFDTATKVYSEMIGNIERDALSAKKYYHFIKLMGRSASHVALECALATHPNYVVLSEEVAEKKLTLRDLTNLLADLVVERWKAGKEYGVILLPEGLIEFLPEMKLLISELNKLEAAKPHEEITLSLSKEALETFYALPEAIQKQLLLERDPHGNVQVSLIETESLLAETVLTELQKRKAAGEYSGKFSPVTHFFGYEGRAAFPTNFESTYSYVLGGTAALLLDEGLTGYICFVKELSRHPKDWKIGGVPFTAMMHFEERKGKQKAVIRKALVNLSAPSVQKLFREREKWRIEDHYRYPGPIQYFGEMECCDVIPVTLKLDREIC